MREVGFVAGALECYVWTGRELSDKEIMAGQFALGSFYEAARRWVAMGYGASVVAPNQQGVRR